MNSTHGADGDPAGENGKKASTGRTILEYAVLAIVAIAVALLVQALLVKPYRIPSESMENTLLIGDRVLVDRASWRLSDPSARTSSCSFRPSSDPCSSSASSACPATRSPCGMAPSS